MFGHRLDLDGTRVVISEIGSTIGSQPGRVSVYETNGTSWTLAAETQASDGHSSHVYGSAVSLDGAQLGVGAFLKSATYINEGGAYVYALATAAPPVLLAADAITVGTADAFVSNAHSNGSLTLNRQSGG